jgi:hypothetical protein
MNRQGLVALGSLGACAYATYLSDTLFWRSWSYPLALAAVGLPVVFFGVRVHKYITNRTYGEQPHPLVLSSPTIAIVAVPITNIDRAHLLPSWPLLQRPLWPLRLLSWMGTSCRRTSSFSARTHTHTQAHTHHIHCWLIVCAGPTQRKRRPHRPCLRTESSSLTYTHPAGITPCCCCCMRW